VLGAICVIRAAPSRFRRALDLDGLIREQAISFPTTAAFVYRHLRLAPPRQSAPRPADYALTPDEWIACFASHNGVFDEAAARRALLRQLGEPWRGVGMAAAPARCLFAAFALHLAERRNDAMRLLGICSAALGDRDRDRPEGPETALGIPAAAAKEADAVLRDGELIAAATGIAGRHAYTHTALMTLLNEARRQSGVLAPGQFAWLKLVDRPLWYALHSLGYETEGPGHYMHPNPRVEAVGARDHWAVECLAGGPVIEPSLDRALAALRQAARNRPQSAGADR
jgi:intracellular multiplication protein IcmP